MAAGGRDPHPQLWGSEGDGSSRPMRYPRVRVRRRQRSSAQGGLRHTPVLHTLEEQAMAIDTFIVFTGVYQDKEAAEAEYDLIKEMFSSADLVDGYDAAVIERREDGKVKLGKKHETPTRVGGVLGGGVGLATGLVVALFPFAAVGGGLLAGTAAGGAVLGAVAGHAAAGMSRHDLKELGEQLDAGEAGLVVVGVADVGDRIEAAMQKAEKIDKRSMQADNEAIEADAREAS